VIAAPSLKANVIEIATLACFFRPTVEYVHPLLERASELNRWDHGRPPPTDLITTLQHLLI
jgi:hypothetical protein